MEKLRELLPIGYTAFNGYVFTKWDCTVYNRLQEDINSYIKYNRHVPAWLLNESHRTFSIICGL